MVQRVVLTCGVIAVLLGIAAVDEVAVEWGTPHSAVSEGGESGQRELLSIAQRSGFDLLPASRAEPNMLRPVVPAEKQAMLHSAVLLQSNARIAAVYWYASPTVAHDLAALKERAFASFSGEMRNLIDDTVERSGHEPIDIFAFQDPRMLEERFVVARIRDALYEFHVREEDESWVQALVLELARKD